MTFVPAVPPPAPSPRANELGSRLTETIDRFREDNPSLSPTEIRQAMRLALKGAGTGGAGLAGALLTGCLIFGVLAFLYVSRSGLDLGEQPLILMTVIGSGIIALAVLAVTLKNR